MDCRLLRHIGLCSFGSGWPQRRKQKASPLQLVPFIRSDYPAARLNYFALLPPVAIMSELLSLSNLVPLLGKEPLAQLTLRALPT